jgi:hypothetical protein
MESPIVVSSRVGPFGGNFRRRSVGLFLCLTAVGCSSSSTPVVVDHPLDKTHENLLRIGTVYRRFCVEQKKPPAGPQDLAPALKEFGDPKEIFNSPRDGQPFVICWGVDLTQPVPWAKTRPVLAYEKLGANGNRWVLTTVRSIEQVDDASFRSSEFPPGHRPPG